MGVLGGLAYMHLHRPLMLPDSPKSQPRKDALWSGEPCLGASCFPLPSLFLHPLAVDRFPHFLLSPLDFLEFVSAREPSGKLWIWVVWLCGSGEMASYCLSSSAVNGVTITVPHRAICEN